jgi:hypothetical protein
MLDVNILVQMLGRINRTGQVVLPKYTIMGLDLPTEKRPLAVASKKLRSLNANTSANSESDTSLKAPDMLNKYGDKIINQYLVENPDVARALNLSPNEDEEVAATIGLSMKVTGRMALLPVEQQIAIYEEIESEYSSLIEYLDKTGQNELEARTLDLKAKILDSKIVYEGKDPETIFGDNTTLHKIDSVYQGKAPTPDEVDAALERAIGDSSGDEIATVILENKRNDSVYLRLLESRREREFRALIKAQVAADADPNDQNKKKLDNASDALASIEAQINQFAQQRLDVESMIDKFVIGKTFQIDTGIVRIGAPADDELPGLEAGKTGDRLPQRDDQRHVAKPVSAQRARRNSEIDKAEHRVEPAPAEQPAHVGEYPLHDVSNAAISFQPTRARMAGAGLP